MTSGTRRLAMAAVMAALPLAVPPPVQAQAAARRAYTASELNLIYSLTYQSSQAQAALARQYSARLNQQKKAIDAKDAQLGVARRAAKQSQASIDALERELATLKQGFTAELAAKDSDFARERQNLEAAANDLLKTSEGKRALEIYLAGGPGSAEAAIEILQRVTAKRNAADKRATAALGLDALDKGRLTSGYVVKLYEDVVAADPGTHWDWVELTRLYQTINNLDRATFAAEQAIQTAVDERDRLVGLATIGNILSTKDDIAGALSSYERSLLIARRLTKLHPDSVLAQRDLLLILNNIGDLMRENVAYNEARMRFEESLVIARRLAKLDPDSIEAQRDLSIGLNNLGDILLTKGNFASALELYEEGLEIRRILAELDSDSTEAQRDVALSLDRIGDLLRAKGDFDGAIARYEESLGVARHLAKIDPDSAEAQRDVFITLYKLERFGGKYRFEYLRDQLKLMQSRNQISPRDKYMVEEVLTRAAEQDARDPPK